MKKIKDWKKEKKVKQNKFNANIIQDGLGKHKGSQLELSVLALYRIRERAGEISNLRHQHTAPIVAGINWRLDFSFIKDGIEWFGEAKGFQTETYVLKKKLWVVFGKAPIEIWRGTATKPYLDEIIYPERNTA